MNKNFTKNDTLAVKGIAIIAMLFHHCYTSKTDLNAYMISYAPFAKETVLRMSLWSKVCVGMFVFLSAYGITLSLKKIYPKKDEKTKYIAFQTKRRIWRILSGFWPVYLFVTAGSLIWARDSFQVYKGGFPRYIYVLLDLLGLSDLMGTPQFIGTWWYLGLALTEVLMLPVLYWFYTQYGAFILIGISYILPVMTGVDMTDFLRWLPAMTLGIWFADRNLLAEIKEYTIPHTKLGVTRVIEALILLILLFFAYKLRFSDFGKNHMEIVDSITPLIVILITYIFLCDLLVITKFLQLLGRHSMNIFLFHNFIRGRWFEGFSYSFRYWWLITLVLILDCLVISIVLEKVKALLCYERFTSWVEDKIKMPAVNS